MPRYALLLAIVLTAQTSTASAQAFNAGQLPAELPASAFMDHGILVMTPGRRAVVDIGVRNAMTFVSETADFKVRATPPPRDKTLETFSTTSGEARLEPGKLAFTMGKDPQGGVTLTFDNGLDRPVGYVAIITWTRNGKRISTPTTTCVAASLGLSIESWGEPLEAIQITQIVDAPVGMCLDPASRSLYPLGSQPPSMSR